MRIARHIWIVLLIIGVLMMGYAGYQVAAGKIYQAWTGRELDRTLATLPPQPPPEGFTYATGSAIGRLEIPRIGLSVVVLEGSDADTLKLGVGRLPSSGMPGETGNLVLAGHRDTFFRALRDIRDGDRITLRTTHGTFDYTVDWTNVVDPTDVSVIEPTPSPALTLVTCYPFYYIGPAPKRFIVRAAAPSVSARIMAPAQAPVPAPDPPPTRPSPFDNPAVARKRPVAAHRTIHEPADPPDDPILDGPAESPAPTPAPPAGRTEFVASTAPALSAAPTPPPSDPASPPAQPAKSPIKRAVHKILGVFSHRDKLQ